MLEKLRRILLREQERGYDDRTVMGGLEALVVRWQPKLAAEGGQTESARCLNNTMESLRSYSHLSADERADLVGRAIELLSEVSDATRQARVRGAEKTPDTPVRGQLVRQTVPIAQVGRSPSTRPEARPAARLATRPTRSASGSVVTSSRTDSRGVSPRDEVGADVRTLWGISDVYASKLRRLGIQSIRDLLYHFPRKYVDYSVVKQVRDLRVGEVETVEGTIWEISNHRSRNGLTVTTAVVADDTGTVQAIWFNQAFLSKALTAGQKIVLSGRVYENMGRLQLKSPDWETPKAGEKLHTGRLVPIYPLTEGLTDRWVRTVVKRAVENWAHRLPDHLPRALREEVGLLPLPVAIAQIHFPDDGDLLAKATRRLAFDEFLIMQLAVLTRRRDWQAQPGNAMGGSDAVVEGFIGSLPFVLTGAQRRVIAEVVTDMGKPQPMSRLLQGEVGSGKTVVATVAAVVAASSGFQAVLMAPTEILAEQHFKTISALVGAESVCDEDGIVVSGELPGLPGRRLRLCVLTGSAKKSQKEALCERIALGEVDVAIGTHALIEEGVQFNRLGLVIVDEQHRFGVMQRATLRQKGYSPDLLVMTATPIPRTLALTMYGDLDCSVIDELPPGRQEIKTIWLGPNDRERAYSFLRQQVKQGRQAFIICPLVEESDKIEAKAAVAEYARLRADVFPDLRLGLLHGRLKGPDKEQVMRAFRGGELDVLVSTAVVEVGVDVPNATLMLIEGADRFGLSQLHQFRGRVGRGQEKSYCLLLADSPSFQAEQRLMALAHTRDGFALAEEDLRLRGPGEFFGTRQSGLPDLKVARFSDLGTLREARSVAEGLFMNNPQMEGDDYSLLREKVSLFLSSCTDLN